MISLCLRLAPQFVLETSRCVCFIWLFVVLRHSYHQLDTGDAVAMRNGGQHMFPCSFHGTYIHTYIYIYTMYIYIYIYIHTSLSLYVYIYMSMYIERERERKREKERERERKREKERERERKRENDRERQRDTTVSFQNFMFVFAA